MAFLFRPYQKGSIIFKKHQVSSPLAQVALVGLEFESPLVGCVFTASLSIGLQWCGQGMCGPKQALGQPRTKRDAGSICFSTHVDSIGGRVSLHLLGGLDARGEVLFTLNKLLRIVLGSCKHLCH